MLVKAIVVSLYYDSGTASGMKRRLNNTAASGRFQRDPRGYRTFLPDPLPPEPMPVLDASMTNLLSVADQALGRLDGVVSTLPNPDLFLAMYVKQEAVLSSQIEGTQASLTDVLAFEAAKGERRPTEDVEEVVNYVAALNLGLELLVEHRFDTWLLRQVHQRLMRGVRGGEKEPGRVRTTQNFIGSGDGGIASAVYVPPPPHMLPELMENLERFVRTDDLPALIQAAYAHAQFETIHPFLDGNGRVGRLLITLVLARRRVLSRPLLYLSLYLKRHRAQYYDRLQAVRTDADWNGWLRFFLTGVIDVARQAVETALGILSLRERARKELSAAKRSATLLSGLDELFMQPVTTPNALAKRMKVTYVTANTILSRLVAAGLLREATGQRRNRQFVFHEYVSLFENARPLVSDETPAGNMRS